MLLRLKLRLGVDGEDELLDELLEVAQSIFLNARYPTTPIPLDEYDNPIIEKRWENIVINIAIELYSKMGAEGQSAHSENGIIRTYEAGDISTSLLSQIPPVVGIARA